MPLNSKSTLVLYLLNLLFYLPAVLSHTLVDEPKAVASKTSQSKSAVPKPTETKSVAPKAAEICTDQKTRLRKEW
jgi:hypothetical protein